MLRQAINCNESSLIFFVTFNHKDQLLQIFCDCHLSQSNHHSITKKFNVIFAYNRINIRFQIKKKIITIAFMSGILLTNIFAKYD